MPLRYEYRCAECHSAHEVDQGKIRAKGHDACPYCPTGTLRRVWSAAVQTASVPGFLRPREKPPVTRGLPDKIPCTVRPH